uniref:FBA_2 domain-containing protein n=1 Tax=Steinernema glaseri TaxID=37863 RepID=A0A1I7ZF97_9BILA
MKEISIDVRVSTSETPLYWYHIWNPLILRFQQLSLDDLRRIRYARVSIDIVRCNQGTKPCNMNALFTHVSARHVERLEMQSVHRVDSLFQNFFPLSVNTIIIRDCIFAADSAFPEWFRRTLRANSLQELRVQRITVEGRSEDVDEDIIHLSLMHGKNFVH